MLVVISDLHLGDGTTAESIPVSAFYLFAKRLRQDAHFASVRYGKYHPIEELDVILMGDILDPIHSTRWFFPVSDGFAKAPDHLPITEPGDKDYVRPWSDPSHPLFAPKLREVTRAMLKKNDDALEVMRKLASGEFIDFDAVNASGERDTTSNNKRIPLKVRFHYMVGNHDWYYHLPGEAFDEIRREIIEAMGLSSPPTPFPHDLRKYDPKLPWQADEAPDIQRLFEEYRVFCRHGDLFDPFNFDHELGRDQATLGDVFAMEVCNRYPEELKRRPSLDPNVVDNLRHITNVRPALATPLWISGQIRRLATENALGEFSETALKRIWDDLADNFLQLDFVRSRDKAFKLDIVDKLQMAVKVSKVVSLETIDKLIYKMQNRRLFGGGHSFTEHALQEPAFLDNSARYILYGHTHHHETVPLDYDEGEGNQIYFNTGTWHTYFDLARKDPKEKKFVPYRALTYITFYKKHEHDERNFETWSGAYA
jgi:UDP-2,3-diacylglucosamine pyrophosphatase LpxH